MKILVIRGENLASLDGPFEINFETEPIRSSGIFAITGPTGAGKSTILDAICLALYDRLPRMDTADKSAAIGKANGDGQQVKYNDVRGILRHGTAAAHAEVDFVGQDRRSYRCRWEVKRARGKASGKFQNQQITLTDLDSGEVIGDKKTDTLIEIEKRIGLSFNQFRRSVLLAQGDFDTFIRAASKDKAELLEKITGTEIYSMISQAAFGRAKEEREALHDLETQLAEHKALSDEERVTTEERAKLAQIELSQIKTDEESLTKAKEWYDTKARLDERIAEGRKLLNATLEADHAAQPDRDTLALTKKGLAVRAELEATAAASSRFKDAGAGLSKALAAEQLAAADRDLAVSVSADCQHERDYKRAAYDAIGPELDKAQQLDAVIETTKTELGKRAELLRRCLQEKDVAGNAFRHIEEALRKAQDEFDAAHRWLDEHKSAEGLSARIEDVTKDLLERGDLENEIASTIRDVNIVNAEVKANAIAREAKEKELARLQDRDRELVKNIESLRQIADGIDRGTAEIRRDQIIRIQSLIDDARNAATAAAKAETSITSADAEKSKQDKIIAESIEAISKIDLSLPAEEARLEEAKRNLDLSDAAESEAAEHLRLTLKDGEPCPVCGAREHPVTEVDRRLKGRIDADRDHVKELETQLAAVRSDRAHAKARIAAAEDSIPDIIKRRSDCEADLNVARQTWDTSTTAIRSGCEDLGVSIPSVAYEATEPEATEPFIRISDTLEHLLVEIKRLLNRASDANEQAVALSAEHEKVRADLDSANAEVVTLKSEEQSRASKSALLGATLQERQKACAAITSRLDLAVAPVFPDWKERAGASGPGFATECRQLVEDWNNCRSRMQRSNAAASQLSADLQGSRATFAATEAAAQEAVNQHSEKVAEVEKLNCERGLVIGGRPVSDVRTEYRRQWEAAEEAWNEAERTRSKAEMAAVAATSNVISARNVASGAEAERDSAERALIEKVQAYEISRELAEAAIARGDAWVRAEETRLGAIREELAAKTATLAERQKEAATHDANDRPQQTLEQVVAALSDIDARRAKASEEFVAANTKLLNNELILTRIAEIKTALENRKEAARVWEKLDDLIGSADGAKFRRYAQSLTFNHLIRLANRHLADLHPRYELQRASSGDLVLQVVDQDMADEVRGVHSLSGGESFLVSLALALGLASMSSSRGIKVESLFIDEGFGSLDSNSLAMAVSVLEQLQATGRRVGVISHVEELKERIAVKVEVIPVGGGRSSVQVVTA